MPEYKKFLIQQQTYDGSTYSNVGDVVDTYTKFGVVCQECPFKHLPEAKDLPKRDWNDEHGDDVFIPTDGIKLKAYDMEVKFLYAGSKASMASNIKSFIEFICGQVNIVSGVIISSGGTLKKNVFLKIYDEYTSTGRRGVTFLSHDNELYFFNDVSIDAIAQFKVKFRVNDPIYNVTNNNGTLT